MTVRPETIATLADKRAIEAEPVETQWTDRSLYQALARTAAAHGGRPAVSFQLKGGPKDAACTWTWAEFLGEVTRTANALRALGIGPGDTVAYLLPNLPETAAALIAGMTAGVVAPINPLLEPEQIAAILRETNAKALITLKPFVKTDLSQKAAYAVRYAPLCKTVLEVDLRRRLKPPVAWIAPFLAPKRVTPGAAKVLSLHRATAAARADRLDFAHEPDPDAPCAYFHTGGTTGAPKVAVHTHRGALYNGWLAARLLFGPQDTVLCPLPLFHVLAAYPMLAACVASGAHFVMPTPAGYRGEGVIANFWKLVERWRASFVCTVPTAVAALMQRPVDADVSTLRYALCGSAAMPPELFRRFEAATGVKILEGYGQTETTCLISCNPPMGERKIGSVGLPFPYTEVSILRFADGRATPAAEGEIGEICVRNPGSIPGYLEASRNKGLFAGPGLIRTGDLGRLDADGYLWITGRAKDLIIRGGHNIDPAVIEDALLAHPDVAFAGAVAQPDAYAGELPCAYVELRAGATVAPGALEAFAAERVTERAARPAHVEVLPELPKTAVGKVFKPALRARATARVYEAALAAAGAPAAVSVEEDAARGAVAVVTAPPDVDRARIAATLDRFPGPWRMADGRPAAARDAA
jgi:acyl-CoA synthetase (AMP-forming)/AMP-acid ligase II